MDILYHEPVWTCVDAAKVRGIELMEELKTILLKVENNNVAVHLQASEYVNSLAVKKRFHCNSIRFLNADELAIHNLSKGIINPWNIDFCDYNIVCKNVFRLDYMYTNNSKLDSSVRFSTGILYKLSNLIVGNYGYTK